MQRRNPSARAWYDLGFGASIGGSGKVFPADKGDRCTSEEWLFGKFSCQRQRLEKTMWSPPTEEEGEGKDGRRGLNPPWGGKSQNHSALRFTFTSEISKFLNFKCTVMSQPSGNS